MQLFLLVDTDCDLPAEWTACSAS